MLHLQEQTRIPYLQATLLPAQDDEVLELDELWSFVASKSEKVWIWIALCRRTRQVVAWHFGPRDERTCRYLWEKIPPEYKSAYCYSDLWSAYGAVLPQDQHQACPKKGRVPKSKDKPIISNGSTSPCARGSDES